MMNTIPQRTASVSPSEITNFQWNDFTISMKYCSGTCALSDNSSNKIIVLSMISEQFQWVDRRKYCRQTGETQSQEAQNPQLLIWQNPGKSVNPDYQQQISIH